MIAKIRMDQNFLCFFSGLRQIRMFELIKDSDAFALDGENCKDVDVGKLFSLNW